MQRTLFLALAAIALVAADDHGGRCRPMSNLPRCVAGAPVYNATTNCFLCRACSSFNLTACPSPATVATCASNAEPYALATCCPSCIVRANSTNICSRDKLDSCGRSIAKDMLPACGAGVTPTYNATTCCINCRMQTPSNEAPLPNKTCTRGSFENCLNTTRTCDATERPTGVSGSCCPSCLPDDFRCEKEDVAKCIRESRPCADGEEPASIGGCCKTCYRLPTCTPACDTDSICIRDKRNASATRCVSKYCAVYRLGLSIARRVNASELSNWVGNVTCSERCDIIQQIVRRYCLTSGAQDPDSDGDTRCGRIAHAIDNWVCANNSFCDAVDSGTFNVKLCLGDPAQAERDPAAHDRVRRLFSMALTAAADSTTFSGVVTSAAADSASLGFDLSSSPASRPVAGVLMTVATLALWVSALFQF